MPFGPPPTPPGMERVDRRELYTSLPVRIHFLLSFLEFTHDDVAALVDGQKYIKAVIPAVVNIIYKKLLKYDITARAFTTRDTRDEGPVDRWVTEESTQIQNRKMFLRWYLIKLNSDPTKMEYWEYLDKVGMMHTGRLRRDPLHIDYVFLGACLGYIQEAMFEAILSHPRLVLGKKIALVKALGKILWIQNDLLERWHNSDGADYKTDHDDDGDGLSTLSDAPGYLNGKKILGAGGGSSSSEDGASLRSGSTSSTGKTSLGRPIEEAARMGGDGDSVRCPFSGMTLDPEAMDEQRAAAPSRTTRAASASASSSAETVNVARGAQAQAQPAPTTTGPARLKVVDEKAGRAGRTARVPSEAVR